MGSVSPEQRSMVSSHVNSNEQQKIRIFSIRSAIINKKIQRNQCKDDAFYELNKQEYITASQHRFCFTLRIISILKPT